MPEIEEILKAAKEAGASDVHLTVGIPPKMRIDGGLVSMAYPEVLPADTLDVLVNIMTQQQREYFEEHGECDLSFSISGCGRFRVNAYKQRGSAALAFRLVGAKVPALEELGAPECLADLCAKKEGMVLVAGPAGSGASTTLAALVDQINESRQVHVITLEEPIEYLHQHKMAMVNQREIGTDSDTYLSALRAALREDPDVILIGELQDTEIIELAIHAAETGHLVLSSLHAGNAAGVVERIVEKFPPAKQRQIKIRLLHVLEAVVFQELVPVSENGGRTASFEVLKGSLLGEDV